MKVIRKRVSRSIAGDVFLFLFLALLSVVMVLPFVYALSTSLKPSEELWLFPPRFFASNPTFENYRDMFMLMTESWVPLSRYLFNSLLITAGGTIGNIMLASMAAYPLSQYVFPGSRGFFTLVTTSLMFSGAVLSIPSYIIIKTLHLLDTYWALIIPACGSTLGLFLMKQFMDQMVHPAILESADIDGANEFTKFFKIVMPMVKPAWLTLTIFSVQSLWGVSATPYIYTEELKTFAYALSQLAAGGLARAGVGAAAAIILLIVPLSVFLISQSNVIETMATSGMKD